MTLISMRAGALALGLVVSVGASSCTRVVVKPSVATPMEQGLSVVGEGSVEVRPDIAIIDLGVEARATDPKRAVDEVSKQMGLIITNLNSMGIAPSDTQTSNFSVRYEPPQHHPDPPPEPLPPPAPPRAKPVAPEAAPQEVGQGSTPRSMARGVFRVNNTLQVKVRNVDRVGEILAVAVEMGANDIGGVRYSVDKPEPLQARAREQAIADAMTKAKAIAQASGVSLGRVMAIDDQGGTPMMAMRESRLTAAAVPMEPGTVEISHRLTMRFELNGAAK